MSSIDPIHSIHWADGGRWAFNGQGKWVLNALFSAETAFFLRPRTSAAGGDIARCFLAVVGGPSPPGPRVGPWIVVPAAGVYSQWQRNMSALGVNYSRTYYQYIARGFQVVGATSYRGFCPTPTSPPPAAYNPGDVVDIQAWGDLDGDFVYSVLAKLLGIEPIYADCGDYETTYFQQTISADSSGSPTIRAMRIIKYDEFYCF